jgi:hypothetical protein
MSIEPMTAALVATSFTEISLIVQGEALAQTIRLQRVHEDGASLAD